MKKVVLVLLLVCMILPMAVYAGPPIDAQGSFVYTPTIVSERWADGNYFIYATDTAIWEGTFEGKSTEEYVAVLHSSGVFFYKGTVSFTGTVEGRAGTLEILFVGKSPGTLVDWTGTWRIIGGGGELANLHGNGTFWNTAPLNIGYMGRIHFDGKAD